MKLPTLFFELEVNMFLFKKLTGLKKKAVTLTWNGRNCSSVEISGLDIGWGQVIHELSRESSERAERKSMMDSIVSA